MVRQWNDEVVLRGAIGSRSWIKASELGPEVQGTGTLINVNRVIGHYCQDNSTIGALGAP